MTLRGRGEPARGVVGKRTSGAAISACTPFSAYVLLVVCMAVGQAVQVANGMLAPHALAWLALALLSAPLVPLVGSIRVEGKAGEQALTLLAAAALAWQFIQLTSTQPGFYMTELGVQGIGTFHVALVAATLLAGLGLSAHPSLGGLGPIAMVAAFLILGRWMVLVSPLPGIDVFFFQREGAEALLQGRDPYALRYPDIYGQSAFYGPGLSIGGRLQFGYPYYPLSLLLLLPAHWLGDFRFAHVAGSALLGLVIMTLRPSPVARAAGALFLFTPRSLFVIEHGWNEPLVLGMLAMVALVAERRPAWLPWALGLLVAVKQYSVFMVPLAFLLLSPAQRSWRQIGIFLLKVAVPGLVITLPFFMQSPRDFWFDVVQLQMLQPFRPDALSLSAWWYAEHGTQPSLLWAFGLTVAALCLCVWRLPRGIGGFSAGVAIVYLTFFATNKQAFCNYYYLVIGAAALATALSVPSASRAEGSRHGTLAR